MNEELVVNIIYFKESGKYYIEEMQNVPFTKWDLISDIFEWLRYNKRLKITAMITVPQHPHDHPFLIIEKENNEK